MSRLGKSFKNRFLRRALALALAGTMVMTTVFAEEMPVSVAAEQSDTETSGETEVQERTEEYSEEAAEDGESVQKESEETKTEEPESTKPTDESETTSEKEPESGTDKEENASSDASQETMISSETEESGTETEEASETEGTEEENEAAYTSSDAAVLAEGHSYAKWSAADGTLIGSDGTPVTADKNGVYIIQNGDKGIYKNNTEDVLYIDTSHATDTGKFGQNKDNIQINANTKIYIPVKADNNSAKITIYQSKAQTKENVIYNKESNTGGYFEISGDDLSHVECTDFKAGDSIGNTTYYKTELTCTVKESVTSSVICVETKINNFATAIISGEKVRDDLYSDTTGDDASLVKYEMEGYANSFGVTGGGVMRTDSANYYTVNTAEKFLQALLKIKKAKEPAVIRITDNLSLGSKEVKNFADYADVITADKFQALWHPVLKESGVSDLNLAGFNDLTIFSTNGAAIKHCNTIITDSENIIIRNLVFDELWEWDDGGTVEAEQKTYNRGGYDRNDWDYMCIDNNSDGVWIDHCTFYKAYDGVIDVKHAKGEGEDERVTISWCKFEPKSAPKEDSEGNITYPFYDAQISYLEEHKAETTYYRQLRTDTETSFDITYTKYTKKDNVVTSEEVTETLQGAGYSLNDIRTYTCGQKKTHLLGPDDDDTSAKGIRVTLANNSYKNSMDRMPRLRYGIAHEYNCILDSSELYEAHYVAKDGSKFDNHLVSNGALSTKGGYVFLENCYIDGISKPLVSGNDASAPGYIGANDTIYMLANKETGEKEDKSAELKVENNNKPSQTALEISLQEFKAKLPETYGTYSLCNASELKSKVLPYAGAGVVKMNPIRWTKTSYGDGTTTDDSELMNWDASADNDPGRYESGIEVPDNPPQPTEGKAFRASSLDVGTLTADMEVNEFYTITKGCEIAEGKATINDIYFTKYIKLAGKGSKENSIKVTSPGKGTLTVYVASNNDSAARAAAGTLNLLDSTGSTVEDSVTDIAAAAAVTLQIPEKGEYYVASEDGELHVYGMDLEAEEGTGDVNFIEFSLSADDIKIPEGQKSVDFVKDEPIKDFIIKATSGAKVTVDGSNKTIEGVKFTQRIKLGGAGDKDKRSIYFTAEDKGTLTVFATSSSSPSETEPNTDRILGLYKFDGEKGTLSLEGTAAGGTVSTIQYEIEEPGQYYLASVSGGINIYYIKFSNKTEEPEEYAPAEVEAEWTTLPALIAESVYSADEAKDSSKVQYNLEGYAGAANVTGGGLIKEGTTGYYKVTNEVEFLEALSEVQTIHDKPCVIEITTDLNLGRYELKKNYNLNILAKNEKPQEGESADYSGVIKAYAVQPKMHPTLKETGVSYLYMHNMQDLTIFSKNGATIKHAGLNFNDVTTRNIIIRNLTFDELWEWDEGGLDAKGKYQNPGDYDINDWDYMVIDEHAEGIWIDHCTFYKAYDGLIDIKNNSSDDKYFQRVTISWCEFLPGSKDNVFFNEQMKWLEDNIDNEEVDIAYYRQLRKEHMKKPNEEDITNNPTMSAQDVWWYVYGQKKAHLLGPADTASEDKVLRVTFANNYHKNAMSRLPRLRFGKVHEYNCVFDAQQMDVQYQNGNPHITGNGAISACNGEMLLENCYIRGLRAPLRSGYSRETDDRGYINILNSVYYYMTKDENDKTNMVLTTPEITESSAGKKITDETKFKEKLPEGYVFTTYDATQLYSTVVPYVGAGKLDMTTVQWEATNYGTNDKGSQTPASPSQIEPEGPKDIDPIFPSWGDPENPDNPVDPVTVAQPTASPSEEAQFPSAGGEVTLDCATSDAAIYYTISETEAGLTDPADAENANRIPYERGTKIAITKETYIWAVAIKDDTSSDPLKCHYTVLAEGAVVKPVATPGSEKQATPVNVGDKVTLTTTAEVDNIYYTTGSTPDTTADPTKESDERQTYDKETGITITEAVTIKAAAKKGEAYSEIATFTYTIKNEDTKPDAVAMPAFSEKEGVVAKGTKVTITCATEGASIYYTTDGSDPKEDEKLLYTAGDEITIDKTTTLRAIAVKDGNTSKENKATYTVEETGKPPVGPGVSDDPDDPGVKDDNSTKIWITGIKEEGYDYTGAKIIPNIKVWDCDIKGNDRLLAPGIDYTAAYKNNVKPGVKTAIVTITGKGNYVGKEVTEKFTIKEVSVVENPISVKGAKLELSKSLEYDGTAHYPTFKLILKGKSPATYVYQYDNDKKQYVRADKADEPMNVNIAVSNNINKGTATILVTGAKENNKTTSAKATFKITPVDISKATIEELTDGVYSPNGAALGTLKVKYGTDKVLVEGIDYTVKYSGNKKAGNKTATVTITGKGNYTKKVSKPYSINKLNMSDVEVSAVTAYDGIAAGKVKATVVDKKGYVLKPAQYELKIYTAAEGGTAYAKNDKKKLKANDKIYVEATAKDTANLEAGSTIRKEFTVGQDISKAKFVVADEFKKGIEYTGSEIKLDELKLGEQKKDYFKSVTDKKTNKTLTVKQADGTGDYEFVSYSNNINKGTATVVIKGIGTYSGTKTLKFKIKQKTMKSGMSQ